MHQTTQVTENRMLKAKSEAGKELKTAKFNDDGGTTQDSSGHNPPKQVSDYSNLSDPWNPTIGFKYDATGYFLTQDWNTV